MDVKMKDRLCRLATNAGDQIAGTHDASPRLKRSHLEHSTGQLGIGLRVRDMLARNHKQMTVDHRTDRFDHEYVAVIGEDWTRPRIVAEWAGQAHGRLRQRGHHQRALSMTQGPPHVGQVLQGPAVPVLIRSATRLLPFEHLGGVDETARR